MRTSRGTAGVIGGLALALGLAAGGGCDGTSGSILGTSGNPFGNDPFILLVLNPLTVPSELSSPVADLLQNGFSAQVLFDLFQAIGSLSQTVEPDLDMGQPFLVAGFRFGSTPQVSVNGVPAPVLVQAQASVPGGTFTALFVLVPTNLVEAFSGNKVKIVGPDGSTSAKVGAIHRLAAVATTDGAACTTNPVGSPHRVEFVSMLDGSLRNGVGAPFGPARWLPCTAGNEDYASIAFSPDGLFDLVADRQNGNLVLDSPFAGGLSKDLTDALGLTSSLQPIVVDLQALADTAVAALNLGAVLPSPKIHIQDVAVQPWSSMDPDFLVAVAASLTDASLPGIEIGVLGAMRLPNLPSLIQATIAAGLGGTVDFQSLFTGSGGLGIGFAAPLLKGTPLPAVPRRLVLGKDGLLVVLSGAPGGKNTQVHVLDLAALPKDASNPPLCDLDPCLATLDLSALLGATDLVDLELLELGGDAAAFLLDGAGSGTLYGFELGGYSCTPLPGGNPPCPGAGTVLSEPAPPVLLSFPGLTGPIGDLAAGTMLDGTQYLVLGQGAGDASKNLLTVQVIALQPVTVVNLSCPTVFAPCGVGVQDPLDMPVSIAASPTGDHFLTAIRDDAAAQNFVQLELRNPSSSCGNPAAAFTPFGCASLAPSSAPDGVEDPKLVAAQGT